MTASRPGEPLGTVGRLQVQREPLKPHRGATRAYEPDKIVAVEAIRVTPRGVVGVRSHEPDILDVHHGDHPRTRDRRGDRGVSLMSDADYRWLRSRFGDHLTDGIAGETITLTGGPELRRRDLSAGVLVDTADGMVGFTQVHVAAPCVEFTRYVLRRSPDTEVDDTITATLDLLDHGARGFVAATAGDGIIAVGDRVFLARR